MVNKIKINDNRTKFVNIYVLSELVTEHVIAVKTLFVNALSKLYLYLLTSQIFGILKNRISFRKAIIHESWYKYVTILIQIQINWLYSKHTPVRQLKAKVFMSF